MNPYRILVIDDNASIHADFRKILCPASTHSNVDDLAASLFGASAPAESSTFEIVSAYQGQDGFEMVKKAAAEGRPFSLAFVDGRMPPGWDGVETIVHIWRAHPELQISICTAYSDYSWEQIIARVGESENLVILKKPFDAVEVQQLAHTMTRRWRLNREARSQMEALNELVLEKTKESKQLRESAEASREIFTSALESARQWAARAEADSKAKSEMLASMNHEIRTPLNGVLGMTSALLRTPLNPDQRDCAETIKVSGETLLSILSNILDYSKIEAGRLSLEKIEFDAAGAVRETVEMLTPRAVAKNLQLALNIVPGIPETLFGDPVRLKQIVLNIVSNGLKFTEAGGVTVQMQQIADSRTHATLSIEITDTGSGIPSELQQNLFTSLAPAAGSMTRRYGSNGLGLTLCRRLVELMGGTIGVISHPGKGSTFRFTLFLEKLTGVAASGDVVKAP